MAAEISKSWDKEEKKDEKVSVLKRNIWRKTIIWNSFGKSEQRETIRLVINAQFKNLHLWWYRDALGTHQCLFQGRPCIFQQYNYSCIISTTVWLQQTSRRALLLQWPSWSWNLSPAENIWNIIKWKIKKRPRAIEQREPISDKNGTPFLSQRFSWSPQFPDVYKQLLKERGMLHTGNCDTETCCWHQFQNYLIYLKLCIFRI